MLALTLLLACRTATIVDACDEDLAFCLPCETDAECVLGGNPCLETVYCQHEDAGIAVIEIGCSAAVEYRWPDASACTCEAGVCSSD